MFERKKLEKIRPVLTQCFVDDFHMGGLTLVDGLTRIGRKYTGAFAKVKKMNETLLRGLGEQGGFRMLYRLDKTLELKLTFSCAEGDEDYALVQNHFYEYEDCNFDDLLEDMVPFQDLELCNNADTTDVIYTVKGVAADAVAARAKRLLDYVFNVYDVYLENLLEEYGEE